VKLVVRLELIVAAKQRPNPSEGGLIVRIGIVGDYTPAFESHRATTESVRAAADVLGLHAVVEWLATEDVADSALSSYDGLWASPGSPYKSMAGMLHAIRFARERLRPMMAT
jgi:CTP synthase (UTP-ammonia lyase)